ncbi:hypothetical protein BDN67DRAFT_1013009, partial [Paxillus ammoniavirescens]
MSPNNTHEARYAYQPQPQSGYTTNSRQHPGHSSSLGGHNLILPTPHRPTLPPNAQSPNPTRENSRGATTSRGRLAEKESSSSSSSRPQRQGNLSSLGAPNLLSPSFRGPSLPSNAQFQNLTGQNHPQLYDDMSRGRLVGTESSSSSSSRQGNSSSLRAPNMLPSSSHRPPPKAQLPTPTRERHSQHYNTTSSRGRPARTESGSSSSSRPGPMPIPGASSQPTYPPPSRTITLSSLPPRRDYDIRNPLSAPEPSQQAWATHNLPSSSQLLPVPLECSMQDLNLAPGRRQTHAMYDWRSSSPPDPAMHSLSSAPGRQQTWPTHNLPQRSPQIPPSLSARPLRNEPPSPPIPAA